MNTQKHLRHTLSLVTLAMTALFGWSLASGLAALLFAVSMVGIQAAALLFLPEKFLLAKRADNFPVMVLHGAVIVAAVLVSVSASIATLSGAEDVAMSSRQERETLKTAIDGYMSAGYITKALEVKTELESLPEPVPSELNSAAVRLEKLTGVSGVVLVNGFIALLALLLDVTVVLLAATPATNATFTMGMPEKNNSHTVTLNENPLHALKTEAVPVMAEPKPQEAVPGEVQAVLSAMQSGKINKPTVRQVRDLLRCSQADAINIARACRQLELTL